MSTPLSALSSIISSAVADIEAAYAAQGETYPSLDEPFRPNKMDDKVGDATNLIVAAAAQLLATVRPPTVSLIEAGNAMYSTAALGIANEANVPEALREAGPKGMHIEDIGKKVGTDSAKLGRVLRYLASRHIFREVAPDVFANNRISSLLDTGKSLDEILADPLAKHDNTSGASAMIAHYADDGLKSCAFMVDNMMDPATSSSQELSASPLARAFNTTLDCFSFIEQPGNEKRFKRFGPAMTLANRTTTAATLLACPVWKSLKKDSLVVDVGGGVGSVTLGLAIALPDVRFVVQDRPTVVTQGIEYFKTGFPQALAQGRVKFQVHDFFQPQPIKDADVFFMRRIAHDWPDEVLRKLLKQLRSAAQPSTKLLLVDHIVPYSAPTTGLIHGIPGSAVEQAPEPLLPNFGLAYGYVYAADMHMMSVLNAQERTIGQFIDLVKGTGWKLDSVTRGTGGAHSTLVFVTVSSS